MSDGSGSNDVILTLTRLMRLYGKPEHIRSDQALNSRRAVS